MQYATMPMLIFRAWATCGRMRRIFLLETSLILFTEAVVTLAVFFVVVVVVFIVVVVVVVVVFIVVVVVVVVVVVCVFFFAHITLRCPHDLNAWNRLVLVQLAIEVK